MRYEAICLGCSQTYDYFSPIAERGNIPKCPECGGGEVRRVILSAPKGFVRGQLEPFKSQVDGTLITCEKDLQEHNKRNNVCLLGDGYSNEDILAGNIGQKKIAPPDKKDIAKDIVESFRKVEAGYKPIIESEGADL